MKKWRRGCGRPRKLSVRGGEGWDGQVCSFHRCASRSSRSQKKAPQDRRSWSAPSPLRDGARRSRPPGKHNVFSPPKREPASQGAGPRPKHKAKPLRLSLVEAKPLLGWGTHAALESRCAAKASGRQARPFPPPPCETPAGTAWPVTSITPLCSTTFFSGRRTPAPRKPCPGDGMLPAPKPHLVPTGSRRRLGGMRISHPTAVIGAVSWAGLSFGMSV